MDITYNQPKARSRASNPAYLALARLAIQSLRDHGVTNPNRDDVWEVMWTNPMALMRALDTEVAVIHEVRGAIHTVLGEFGPAYISEAGWKHVDAAGAPSAAEYSKVLEAYGQRIQALEHRREEIQNERTLAEIRESTGVEVTSDAVQSESADNY